MCNTDFCYRRDTFCSRNINYNTNSNYYDNYLVRRQWCERNADKLKQYYKNYYQNNKEKLMIYNRKQYYFNYHPEEYHSKWILPPKKEMRIQKARCYYERERKIRIKIFSKFKVEIMNRKEMIEIILELSDEYPKSSLSKMKVDEVLEIYTKVVAEFENEQCDSAEDEVDEVDEVDEFGEPNNKKAIRRFIFNDIIDNQFNKFNEYFTSITNYKIDDEMEQAVPKDGCWTNFSPDNLKLYGNYKKDKYENADEETFRKEMIMKYNYYISN
jgi:hypothetical protein